jgi:peptidoglycan/xylan/chitin deacetylase (PgdA/CDA1 family)
MYLVRPPYLFKKIYPEAVWRKSADEKKIYLSFDDGPIPEATPFVLELLKRENIKATFFCVGNNIDKHPTIFQNIIDENHRIGNHTYNHLNGWNTHSLEYIQNYKKCNNLLHQFPLSHQTPLFRPPYGRMKKKQSIIIQRQSKIIMWDVLSGDFDKNTSPEQCLKNVTENLRNGSIIVFHDSIKASKNMMYALPRFIDFAKAEGYKFEIL